MEENQNLSKEPWLAVVLSSCWAGVGQIYASRIRRGIILILVEAIFIFLSYWSLLIPKCDVLISIGLILVIYAVIIWNLFDAHKCARKANSHDFEAERKLSKDPWLALFLSDLIPGLGHFYLKKWLFGIFFIIIGGLMLIVGCKYKLLYIALWGFIDAFICFHAYVVTPIRREKSKKTILIVCAVFLCLSLLSYNQLLVRKYVVEAFRIPTPTPFDWIPPEQQWGSSMEPTLVHEDRFLVRKNKKYMLKRGDVVVFKSPDDPNIPFTMRIAALSGEKIRIKNGILYIDMQKVNWRTIEFNEYSKYKYGINEPYKVPENCFFVLGDNSENSEDSRIYGAIPLSDLIGKAYKIYWPLGRRDPIE